jgi:hypothetical protein
MYGGGAVRAALNMRGQQGTLALRLALLATLATLACVLWPPRADPPRAVTLGASVGAASEPAGAGLGARAAGVAQGAALGGGSTFPALLAAAAAVARAPHLLFVMEAVSFAAEQTVPLGERSSLFANMGQIYQVCGPPSAAATRPRSLAPFAAH